MFVLLAFQTFLSQEHENKAGSNFPLSAMDIGIN